MLSSTVCNNRRYGRPGRLASTGMGSRRLIATLGAVAALTTGCATTVTGTASPSAQPDTGSIEVFERVEAPAVGTCVDTVRGGSGPLGAPATLACSEPHGGEIAKVVEVPNELDGDYPTDDELGNDAWSSVLYGNEGCGEFRLTNTYLGARDQDNLLADYSAYLPKKSAWEAGARWVACVVEYQLSLFEEVDAPGLMADAMRGPDADSYRPCWFGPQIVYDVVPCSQPHEAEPTGDYVSAEPGTPYPTDPLARQPLVDECTDRVIDYLERDVPNGYAAGVYVPSAEDWADFPEVSCVILDAGGRRTSGSAVEA